MAEKYIDIKCTVWERVFLFEDEDIKEIIEKITKEGVNILFNDEIVREHMVLEDTSTFMETEENDNQPTIEVYKNLEIVWDNINFNYTE